MSWIGVLAWMLMGVAVADIPPPPTPPTPSPLSSSADDAELFRLTEHIERLHDSAKILGMELPYGVDELIDACKLVVRDSGLPSCYVRPIAYYGYGEMGLATTDCTVDVAIARALVAQPSFLFADEPTSHQDHKSTEEILKTLAATAAAGAVVVVTAHDPRILEAGATGGRFRLVQGRLKALK